MEPPSFTPREAALLAGAARGVPTPSPGRPYCVAHAAARAKMGRPRLLPELAARAGIISGAEATVRPADHRRAARGLAVPPGVAGSGPFWRRTFVESTVGRPGTVTQPGLPHYIHQHQLEVPGPIPGPPSYPGPLIQARPGRVVRPAAFLVGAGLALRVGPSRHRTRHTRWPDGGRFIFPSRVGGAQGPARPGGRWAAAAKVLGGLRGPETPADVGAPWDGWKWDPVSRLLHTVF